MPKLKTNKSIKSRFKVTKSGKLKASRCGRRHILTKKSSKRKRHLKTKLVLDKPTTKKYSMMLGL